VDSDEKTLYGGIQLNYVKKADNRRLIFWWMQTNIHYVALIQKNETKFLKYPAIVCTQHKHLSVHHHHCQL